MTRSTVFAAVFSLVSQVAWAAEPATPAVEEKKASGFSEIERGVFLGMNAGYWAVVNPPGKGSAFSSGQAIQVEVGGDIGERVALAAFFMATSNRMGANYFGNNAAQTASGDYGAIMPGISGKFRIVGFDDSQDVKRTWIYVRAQAGVAFYSPAGLKLPLDVMISGGPGVEYFTRLRHFSIALEADFNFMALTGSFGFSVLPSVRYAF